MTHKYFLIQKALFVVVGVFLLSLACQRPVHSHEPHFEKIFIGVEQFESYQKQGASILDVRSEQEYKNGHIRGAFHTPWTLFVDSDNSGLVSENDEKLHDLLKQAGIRKEFPVLIYGNWSHRNAWGEEGRLLWMMHYLGHDNVYILQGGIKEWKNSGKSLREGISRPLPGNFKIQRQATLRALTPDVIKTVEQGNAQNSSTVFIDTREAVEYNGQTKYGESRGGRIPGARHLWWYDLFDHQGQLRSPEQLRQLFSQLGITSETTIIPYCTGGIRSGFVYAVLAALDYNNIKNYDGSMWDYTLNPNTPLELDQN